MKKETFKNLVIDTYRKSKEGNLVGILYGAVSTYGFSEIMDIEGFTENCNPDMLYLKSKLIGTEVDVYEWELEDYKIKESESIIYIKLKGKMEVGLMY